MSKRAIQPPLPTLDMYKQRPILLHARTYPGGMQYLRAFMERFKNRFPVGWTAANGSTVGFREKKHELPTRFGWELFRLNRPEEVELQIEAYEELAEKTQTRIDVLDATHKATRRTLGEWISRAALEFLEMVLEAMPEVEDPEKKKEEEKPDHDEEDDDDEEEEEEWPKYLPTRIRTYYRWRDIYRIWLEMLDEYAIEGPGGEGQQKMPAVTELLEDLSDRLFPRFGKKYSVRHLRSIKRAGEEHYFDEWAAESIAYLTRNINISNKP